MSSWHSEGDSHLFWETRICFACTWNEKWQVLNRLLRFIQHKNFSRADHLSNVSFYLLIICQETLARLRWGSNMFILIRTVVLMICIHLHIMKSFPVFLSSISGRRQQKIYLFLPVSFAAKEVRVHLNVSFTLDFQIETKQFGKRDPTANEIKSQCDASSRRSRD